MHCPNLITKHCYAVFFFFLLRMVYWRREGWGWKDGGGRGGVGEMEEGGPRRGVEECEEEAISQKIQRKVVEKCGVMLLW